MKKFIYFLLFILIFSDIKALEQIKEVKLNFPEKYDIDGLYLADYDLKNKRLLISAYISNIIPISQDKMMYDNRFKGVFLFANSGNLISEIGKFNSYDQNGIVDVFNIKIDDKIQIYDSKKRQSLIFESKEPFDYLYSIVGNRKSDPEIIYQNKAFSSNTGDNKYIVNGKNDYKIDIDKFMRTSVSDIVDTDNPKIKKIDNVKKIASYKKYFYDFWYDDRILKNKVIKKYLKKEKDQYQNFSFKVLNYFFNIGPPLDYSHFVFNKNNFYICTSYGTDIIKYNYSGDSLDVYHIKKYADMKKTELDKYKTLFAKKVKSKKSVKKFTRKYDLSSLRFFLKSGSNLVLGYRLHHFFKDMFNIPEAKYHLLVYSLDKRKVISDFIPIDFIPVKIDAENKLLIGVKEKGKDFYLQFYKWEY